jgi:hypothetical protein
MRLLNPYLQSLLLIASALGYSYDDAASGARPDPLGAGFSGNTLDRAASRGETSRVFSKPLLPGPVLMRSQLEFQKREDARNATGNPQPGSYSSTVLFNVKDFGAKGDGVSDDYDALRSAAAATCRWPGSTLTFPAGVYRVDRYRITGGPNGNGVQNIQYVNCSGNTIVGYGAKIDVKGDFRRTADYITDGYTYSYVDSVVPFEMIDSSGFTIEGFEIAGNVDQMSRDAGVVEGNNAAVFTTHCADYLLRDVFAHHFSADGITIGGNSELADQRFRVDNVSSKNNARDGLSIIQARSGTITNSTFDDNGRTGAYGNHPPAAGMDIEPERKPPQEDVYTGSITIDNCEFAENIGSQFVSGFPELVESVSIQNSLVKATSADTSGQAFLNVPASGLISHNKFQVGAGRSVMLSVDIPAQYASIVHLTYDQNTFQLGENKGIIGPIRIASIDFTNNSIQVAGDHPDSTLMRLDYMASVVNNYFFEAQTGYSGSLPTILYEFGSGTIKNNVYDTDLTRPGFFEVYYGLGIMPSGEVFPHPQGFISYYKSTASRPKRPIRRP